VTYESGQLDTFKQLLNPLRAVAEIEYDDQGGYSNVCASSYVRATKKSIVSKDGVFNCAGAEDKYVIIGSLRTNATRSYCIDATGFSGTISASERIGAVGRTACNFDPDAKVQDPPPVTAADYTTGATDARVKIVTYTDFDCPFCKQFHDTLSTIVNEYDDVSVTYRHFPLEALFPNAKKIAITAECVGMLKNDNVFWKFADKLFASREINETTNINVVDSLAVKVGASRSKLVTCQLSDAAREAVEADMGEGLHSGVTGAPMSFIFLDDQVGRIDGAQPLAIVKQILDKLSE
jgi:protein-disulfide isomerase